MARRWEVLRSVGLADDRLTAVFPEKCLQQIEVRFGDGQLYFSPTLSARGVGQG